MSHCHAVRLLRSTGLALLVGALLVPSAPTSAADSWPVPDDATLTIDGLGYGHGRGLSQYGALGRARAGHGYRKIVNFYYPGTRWGSAGGKVKVLITADTSRDVVVTQRSGLTVHSLGTGKTWKLTPKLARQKITRWRIELTPSGRSAVSFKTRSWHQWRVVRGDAEFSAGGQPVTLHTPAGTVKYRGVLRSASPSGSGTGRDTVNVVSLDSYLKGVVPREVPALWPTQAVRAQSVAARTYAAYERANAPRSRHYQICDTAHCQVYGGYSAEYPTSNDAVQATAHKIVTAGGDPAFAQFSASNGGWTVAGAFNYQRAKPDEYDHYNPDGTGGDGWQATVTSARIEKEYNFDNLVSFSIDTRDGHGEWGGRVETMTLTSGTGFQATVTGDNFRSHLGLKSTWFTISSVDPA